MWQYSVTKAARNRHCHAVLEGMQNDQPPWKNILQSLSELQVYLNHSAGSGELSYNYANTYITGYMYKTIPWIVGYSKTLEPIHESKNRGLVKGTMAHLCSEYDVEVKKKKNKEALYILIWKDLLIYCSVTKAKAQYNMYNMPYFMREKMGNWEYTCIDR